MARLSASHTDQHVLAELGGRARQLRLDRNETQAELAAGAGVSADTVARFEDGTPVNARALVRILRALGLIDRLDQLIPEPQVSPLRLVDEQQRARRRRASGRRSSAGGDRPPGDDDFRWGTT